VTADALTTLKTFYADEAAYLTAGAAFDRMAACLAPDVVMYQAVGLPYGGQWRGHDGMRRFMTAMSEAWDSLEFVEQRFVADADNVAVYNRGRLRARATGRLLDTSVMQWITVRGGLISEFRPFYLDTMAVREALGY
jgi:ketosteroid isomerase-like protein